MNLKNVFFNGSVPGAIAANFRVLHSIFSIPSAYTVVGIKSHMYSQTAAPVITIRPLLMECGVVGGSFALAIPQSSVDVPVNVAYYPNLVAHVGTSQKPLDIDVSVDVSQECDLDVSLYTFDAIAAGETLFFGVILTIDLPEGFVTDFPRILYGG